MGSDGRVDPGRIAAVIARYEPDVIALQELDIGHARTGHLDQPQTLAEALGMHYHFHPAIEEVHERYGDAILSRYPLELMHAAALPGPPRCERRGALWVRLACRGRTVHVLNTHLGLARGERLAQAAALTGARWLGHHACAAPRLFCGDFNAWPGTRAYQRLRRVLHDAQERRRLAWRRNTFPARCPVVCIDHVFHSPDLIVRSVAVPRTPLTRIASDHLPIVVDFDLP